MPGLSRSTTLSPTQVPTLNWTPSTTSAEFQPSTWVRLHDLPSPFSFDEAWLLCECENNQWLAWVPDHGEILLNEGEFSRVG